MADRRRIALACGREAHDIAAVLEQLEAALAEAGCPIGSRAAFLVVAEEMVTNVARHAWPIAAAPGVFKVSAVIRPREGSIGVLLTTEDDGIPFDPTSRPGPDTTAPVEQRAVGGLGIHLVMRMTVRQRYRRLAGCNRFAVLWRGAPPAA